MDSPYFTLPRSFLQLSSRDTSVEDLKEREDARYYIYCGIDSISFLTDFIES